MKFIKRLCVFVTSLCCLACSACGAAGGGAGDFQADPSNILVVYFSATGNTERVAGSIAEATGGTLYEIEPQEPYSAEDLNYGNSDSRATREQNTPSARPAIKGEVGGMENYETVFLGYPIWWGQAPKIICTFLEKYDLSGKTVIPFCTSGSSGIGNSAENLHGLASGATWLAGRRFSSDVSQKEVEDWVTSLGLGQSEEENEMSDEIFLTINGRKICVKLEKNAAADALAERLKRGDVTYTASEYGGFEKVGSLGFSLPRSDVQMTTEPCDVVLYAGDQIVLFYGSNSWSYTKLGKAQGMSAEEWKTVLTEKDPIAVKIGLR